MVWSVTPDFRSSIHVHVFWPQLARKDVDVNEIDRHDVTKILLKVALNTINQINHHKIGFIHVIFVHFYLKDITYWKIHFSVNKKFFVLYVFIIGVVKWCSKPESPEKTTDLSQVTDKLYHIMLQFLYNSIQKSHACMPVHFYLKDITYWKIHFSVNKKFFVLYVFIIGVVKLWLCCFVICTIFFTSHRKQCTGLYYSICKMQNWVAIKLM
jgi:hypothetical protein